MKTVFIIAVCTFIIITFLVFNRIRELRFSNSNNTSLIEAAPLSIPITDAPIPTQIPVNDLKNAITEALSGSAGSYGIVVKNFKTGQTYALAEHRKFESASLYKLWVMATAYDEIQKGNLKEDEILSSAIKALNDSFNIGSESAELTTGAITLSVKNAFEQMITNSHNYAALLLSKRLRLTTVSKYIKENGFNESSLGEPPTTTAYDIALFLEKLYKGTLINQEYSQKMTDVLKRQTLNGKLPKYLPQGISIAHKTGELGYFSHDAGIVFSESGDYIIVVLSESNSPRGAEERISQVSKAVFDSFL